MVFNFTPFPYQRKLLFLQEKLLISTYTYTYSNKMCTKKSANEKKCNQMQLNEARARDREGV